MLEEKMKTVRNLLGLAIAASFLLAGCGGQPAAPAAKIVSISGQVEARAMADQSFITASADQQLMAGGAVRTGKDSVASLLTVADSAKVDVAADSYFEVRAGNDKIGFQGDGKAVFDVNKHQKSIVVERSMAIPLFLVPDSGSLSQVARSSCTLPKARSDYQ